MLLKIKNLRLKTVLGVYDWEQNFEREIVINLEIENNTVNDFAADNLEDTIDYAEISQKIKSFIINKKFKLIERMANEVINQIMEDKRIDRCKIEIDKVGAIDFIDSASVTIEKRR